MASHEHTSVIPAGSAEVLGSSACLSNVLYDDVKAAVTERQPARVKCAHGFLHTTKAR